MRTPDVFLSGLVGQSTPKFHECRACGKPFKHRPNRNVFCSNKCNWWFNGDTRKVLHLLGRDETIDLVPRAMLDFVTQTPSRSYAANINEIREELDFLDHFISVTGPGGASLQKGIKQRADSIRAYLETRTYPNRDEICAYVRALEILRDICSESPGELLLRRSQAWAAVCYYRKIKDFPSLTRALESFANVCQLLGDKRKARKMTRLAYNVLEEQRSSLSPNALLIRHQTLVLDLRSCGEGYADAKALRKHDALLDLSAKIGTPVVWLQTEQELAGYYRTRGWIEEAQEAMAKVDELVATVSPNSFYRPTSMRAKVEFFVDCDRDRAVDLIEGVYLTAYRESPRAYHLGHLRRWEKKLGFSLPADLPRPFDSPILAYGPRGEL
jgi:hypothetical protein